MFIKNTTTEEVLRVQSEPAGDGGNDYIVFVGRYADGGCETVFSSGWMPCAHRPWEAWDKFRAWCASNDWQEINE